MPLYWRNRTLLIKTETVYGTDSVPTGAANAILATDVSFMPMEGEDIARELDLPWMGAQGTIAAGVYGKCSFKVELKGSGTAGTAPAFGPLLRACQMAEVIVAATSVTYNRITDALSAVTIKFNAGATDYVLRGARGTCIQRVNAQGIVYLEFTFTGLFTQPTAQTTPTPVFGTQMSQMPQVANNANTPVFTIGGTAHVLHNFALDWGSTIEPRLLIGAEEIVVPAISELIEMTIDAVPLATLNPFSLAATGTTQAIVLTHGTGAGKIVTLNIPRAQFQRPGAATQNQGVIEWPLRAVPLPNTGNDQFTLAFT